MKKKYIASMISFTTIQAAMITPTQAAPAFPNLPKTCLPEIGRMSPDRSDACHCPPVSMCSETINYNNTPKPKLPGFIRGICCPLPQLPPPPPSPPINPSIKVNGPVKDCDIHYYKKVEFSCVNTTFIGSRTARFCSAYQTTNAGDITRIDNLNNCLNNTCLPIRNKIYNRTTYRPERANTLYYKEWHEGLAQLDFKDYITCRQTCFTNNSLSNLLTTGEQTLNDWILTDTHDNSDDISHYRGSTVIGAELSLLAYRQYPQYVNTALGQVRSHELQLYIANNDPSILKHFTAKTYGLVAHSTVNQLIWDKYFNNTYAPYKLGHGQFNYTLRTDDPNIYNVNNTTNADLLTMANYFLGKITPQGFKTLDQITVDPPTPYTEPTLAVAGVTCTEYDDFNTCFTTEMNDGSCNTCLSPETKITLSDESSKAIKYLKSGDSIKAPYGKTAIIDEVVKLDWKELALYNINDGALRLTADHPVMTTEGWRAINYNARKDEKGYKRYGLNEVGVLKVGDIIVTEKGNVEITRIMPEAPVKDGITYNLKLKDNAKSFYANGILVKSHD